VVETFDLVAGTRTVFGKEFLMTDPGVGDVIHDVGRVVSTLRSTSRSRQDATTWFTEELARISINSPAPFWRATKEQRPTGCSVDRAVEALCASTAGRRAEQEHRHKPVWFYGDDADLTAGQQTGSKRAGIGFAQPCRIDIAGSPKAA
jgi:hypothetical protein